MAAAQQMFCGHARAIGIVHIHVVDARIVGAAHGHEGYPILQQAGNERICLVPRGHDHAVQIAAADGAPVVAFLLRPVTE